ncbi:hypothetical protein DIURU_002131 [Diutina rugosa]|uniref:Extracellular membrane protein CFEM domain-containing protein n=1 Tax=Diutina rugosa TaxID=5481 RepID=A0A642URE1_DIURU|nr:uncharacterized protein DIURU_002131 [Diutina rugosa]KAA8903909.1 hypothetical protein DIURU_002131 [Diutina rugosa]
MRSLIWALLTAIVAAEKLESLASAPLTLSEAISPSNLPSQTLQPNEGSTSCGPGSSQCVYASGYEAQLCPVVDGQSTKKLENPQHLQCLCLVDMVYWDSLAKCRCNGLSGAKLKEKFCSTLNSTFSETMVFNMPSEYYDDNSSDAKTVSNSFNLTGELLTDDYWNTRVPTSSSASEILTTSIDNTSALNEAYLVDIGSTLKAYMAYIIFFI